MKLTGDVTVVVLKNSSIDAMKPLSVQGKLHSAHSHERASTHCFLLTAEGFSLQSKRPIIDPIIDVLIDLSIKTGDKLSGVVVSQDKLVLCVKCLFSLFSPT